MNNDILYIGLKGYAGSGKDTVAKMLKIILSNKDKSLNECFNIFNKYENKSATFNNDYDNNNEVFCIAYADELKSICSSISGVPVEKFYTNKSHGWINIDGDFTYTEIMPNPENIVTASNYRFNNDKNTWMSLREFLVYVGTYILQYNLNKNTFINIVNNKIKNNKLNNDNLKYVIITDNRFIHEIEYIKNKNGILLSIERDNINKLNNIAESLDDSEYLDEMLYFKITNNGSYFELFSKLFNFIKDNVIFKNVTYKLQSIDNIYNYIRLTSSNDDYDIYELNYELGINLISHQNEKIVKIQLIGAMNPIEVGKQIPGTNLICNDIIWNEHLNKYGLVINKQ